MEYSFLPKIKSPDDVKKLNKSEVGLLCEELRSCIINTVSENGGHLASNLGAVELTVALHRAFNSPEDAIIFDVGHQSYAHKLLTGRFDKFSSIRCENGLSGFMRPDESEHDRFITGHSSNSISAAFGIYKAKKLNGEKGTCVAVIGDGAMTGGLAYEALNNAGITKGNFIVVLNDNKMSISNNVGSLSRALTKMRNKPKYHSFKTKFSRFILKIPFFGEKLHKRLFSIKEALKSAVYKTNIFTNLGFNYLGPVDGHDVEAVEELLKIAKSYDRPSLVHVITTKGKGYYFAEKRPRDYHGVSAFNVDKGAKYSNSCCFSAVAGETITKLAENDAKICAVTAAMAEGTGLNEFANKHKSRFFDVGIAEEHAVTFSAGLAKGGMKPYFFVYSTFLQRGFDQIIHDTAIGGFPVKFMIDRAGIVGEDGETHQGLFDVSFLTSIPKMNIYSPSTYDELRYRMSAVAKTDEICAVRYPRGSQWDFREFDIKSDFSLIDNGNDKLIVTYGRLYSEACKVLDTVPCVSVLKLNKIYPFSDELLNTVSKFKRIEFFEESVKNGGIGEHMMCELNKLGFKNEFNIHAVENRFVGAAETRSALRNLNLDSEAMIRSIK